jgi:hypothetical protein
MNDNAFLTTFGLTLAMTGGVMVALHRPLGRMIARCCQNDDHRIFTVRAAEVLLVLVPLTLLFLGSAAETDASQRFLVAVVQYAKFSLMGEIGAIFVVAALVCSLLRPMMSSIWVAPHQVSDMERLLARVDQIRAREILRRVTDPSDS